VATARHSLSLAQSRSTRFRLLYLGWAGDWGLVRLGRDYGAGTEVPYVLTEGVAGVATIRDDQFWRARKTSEQALRLPQFAGLAGCQREGHSAPRSVRDHAGLGAKATARPAKRLAQVSLLGRVPLLRPPAAFWRARTLVPSRKAIASPTAWPWASLRSRCHTSSFDHRRKSLAALDHGPKSAGIARQAAPLQ
jgi:hypothetical protein